MVEIQNVSKTYHTSSRNPITVLDDITLFLEPQKSYGLVGHNGAGKTTLLKCITTLARPTRGTISVNGHDIIKEPGAVRKDVSFLSASVNVDPFFSVRYLFKLYGKMYGLKEQTLSQRTQELFDYFELYQYCDRKVGELSTGMKQRAMLALSLLHDANLYIFDEPTNGLDILTSKKVISYLCKLRENGKTIIISSHIMSEIEKTCDEIIMLVFGKVVASGTRASILKDSSSNDLEDSYLDYYKKNVK